MTNDDANQTSDLLDTLRVTRVKGRDCGGSWVTGTIGGHRFDALVFRDHAECESYELGQSRISKLSLKRLADNAIVSNFERGWDLHPVGGTAQEIVDLLNGGLANLVFGE